MSEIVVKSIDTGRVLRVEQPVQLGRTSLPVATARRIFKRDGARCRYDPRHRGPFEIDHVVHVALGGEDSDENLVVACRSCNRSKGASVWTPKPVGFDPPKPMPRAVVIRDAQRLYHEMKKRLRS